MPLRPAYSRQGRTIRSCAAEIRRHAAAIPHPPRHLVVAIRKNHQVSGNSKSIFLRTTRNISVRLHKIAVRLHKIAVRLEISPYDSTKSPYDFTSLLYDSKFLRTTSQNRCTCSQDCRTTRIIAIRLNISPYDLKN